MQNKKKWAVFASSDRISQRVTKPFKIKVLTFHVMRLIDLQVPVRYLNTIKLLSCQI